MTNHGTNPDIDSWLVDLGLGDYAQAFADNRVDFDVLGDLGEDDLREMGLALGDRKRLLKAIESLAGVSVPETAEPVASAAPTVLEGERRQVAVLFADISGFTRLAAERDAEEIHQLLNRFFAAVDGVVQSFGGNVDKHIGDAVMAVFGAPVAHTDDPERAVRAALALHNAVAELDPPLQIHIGVAAGQVVASNTGSAAHLEYTVTGETVNLASRLTDLAKGQETLISGAVRDELGDRLDGEGLGKQDLPGLPDPVPVWRVNGLAEGDAFVAGLFIGRKAERGIFAAAVDAVLRNGTGQTLYIRGEAGIGKTRLLHEFQNSAAERGFQSHGGQVLDFGVGEGQDAVRVLLRSLLGLAPGAGQNLRAAAADRVTDAGLIQPEQRLHLNDLLNLAQSEAQRPLYEAMDIVRRGRGRVETLLALVSGLSRRSPLLLRLEDLHWAEPGLLDYLTGLVTVTADHPVLLLLTSRLQGDPLDAAWRGGIGSAAFLAMDLEPLDLTEAQSLVIDIEGIDAEWAAACIERSGGNPLFLEQLLRSQNEGQVIPGSVQSVVQSRIDGLSAQDRAALQAASVLGQRFALDALRSVMDDGAYQPDNLLQYNLVRRSEGAFQFYHALFRDTVHGAFLKGRRQALHLRAADWFQDRDAVLYAEHLGEADSDRAPIAFQRAALGEVAAYRADRALDLVERGLALLGEGSDRFDLSALRADLLRQLGRPEDALTAFEDALGLATTELQRCMAWIGIAAAHRLRGQGERGLEVLDKAEDVANTNSLQRELAEIYYLRGNISFATGAFEHCLEQQNKALHHARAAGSPEWEANALSGLTDAEYARGHMRNTLDNYERCLVLCRDNGLLSIEARNASIGAVARRYLGDQAAAVEDLKTAAALAERIHDVRGSMIAHLVWGEMLIDMGAYDAAEGPLETALSTARSLSNGRIDLYGIYELARQAWARSQKTEAIDLLKRAFEITKQTGITFHGPRLFALKARFAHNRDACMQALADGQALVDQGGNAHNILWFHRDAIDACLAVDDPTAARTHADALTNFITKDDLPWARFFAARGYALAAAADGNGDMVALALVHEQGRHLTLNIALPEIEAAQSELA